MTTQTTVYRVTYMERGRSEHTGIYFDRSKCEKALRNFKQAGSAWLQQSTDNGQTWRHVDGAMS